MVIIKSVFLSSTKKTIVIAGAGFGGLRTALDLNSAFQRDPQLRQDYNLYLVDANDHHLFTPSLYEMATSLYDDARAAALKKAIAVPLEKIFTGGPARFHQARITGLDVKAKKLKLNDRITLPYDYLVLALGAEVNFYGIPSLKENAQVLSSLASAIKLRNAIEQNFCQRLGAKNVLNIVIGGGGVSGVELAGELGGYIRKLKRKYQARLRVNITLVEGQKEILAGFHPIIVRWAKSRLQKLGVKLATGEFIGEIKNGAVLTKAQNEFPFSVLIWSGGIKPNRLTAGLPFKKDAKGRLITSGKLCPLLETGEECANVFVVGDNCCLIDNPTLPQTAQIAIDQGRHVAKVILAEIRKRSLPKYRPIPNRYVLPVGGKFALADLGFMRMQGLPAWTLKEFIFLKYLFSILPPLSALGHWLRAVNLFIKND
ncbi:MAG: FAD-dependent oxidoreductase [Parcubacteria group bacterium]|nr:FAD-dependent oxidoreductase [Parcubacteria group bacterium]